MNTSPHARWQRFDMEDQESAPLDRENDINKLHQELCALIGNDKARGWYHLNVWGSKMSYAEKCAAYVAEINRVCDAMPVIDVAAWIAMVDDDERPAPLVTGRVDCAAECPIVDEPRKIETEKMLAAMNSAEAVARRGTVLTPHGWRKPGHHYKLVDGVWKYQK